MEKAKEGNTDCVSDSSEIGPHLCDAQDRVGQDAGLATGFNHRERRLELVELVNRILSDETIIISHDATAIQTRDERVRESERERQREIHCKTCLRTPCFAHPKGSRLCV